MEALLLPVRDVRSVFRFFFSDYKKKFYWGPQNTGGFEMPLGGS